MWSPLLQPTMLHTVCVCIGTSHATVGIWSLECHYHGVRSVGGLLTELLGRKYLIAPNFWGTKLLWIDYCWSFAEIILADQGHLSVLYIYRKNICEFNFHGLSWICENHEIYAPWKFGAIRRSVLFKHWVLIIGVGPVCRDTWHWVLFNHEAHLYYV